MASLIVQQLYRELLAVADEQGGKLKNRVMFYLDEIGTIPQNRITGDGIQRRSVQAVVPL